MGAFLGFDPKENRALIIVLWNAIILHARWGGFVRERGLMNMAIFGNIVTSFSWFGVNMLGAGLHSYGFMDRALMWLVLFDVWQLFFIGLGMLPFKFWLSFRMPRAGCRPRPRRCHNAAQGLLFQKLLHELARKCLRGNRIQVVAVEKILPLRKPRARVDDGHMVFVFDLLHGSSARAVFACDV